MLKVVYRCEDCDYEFTREEFEDDTCERCGSSNTIIVGAKSEDKKE